MELFEHVQGNLCLTVTDSRWRLTRLNGDEIARNKTNSHSGAIYAGVMQARLYVPDFYQIENNTTVKTTRHPLSNS